MQVSREPMRRIKARADVSKTSDIPTSHLTKDHKQPMQPMTSRLKAIRTTVSPQLACSRPEAVFDEVDVLPRANHALREDVVEV